MGHKSKASLPPPILIINRVGHWFFCTFEVRSIYEFPTDRVFSPVIGFTSNIILFDGFMFKGERERGAIQQTLFLSAGNDCCSTFHNMTLNCKKCIRIRMMKIPHLISYEDILRIRIRNNVYAAKRDSATAKGALIYYIHLEGEREKSKYPRMCGQIVKKYLQQDGEGVLKIQNGCRRHIRKPLQVLQPTWQFNYHARLSFCQDSSSSS